MFLLNATTYISDANSTLFTIQNVPIKCDEEVFKEISTDLFTIQNVPIKLKYL